MLYEFGSCRMSGKDGPLFEARKRETSKAMTTRILTEFARLPAAPKPDDHEPSLLTLREIEVLKQLRTGATNREIADHLIISENTVKNHVRNILTKYNLHTRRQAVSYLHKPS